MSSSLRLCSSCSRHVRSSEAACPFCGQSLDIVATTPRGSLAPNKAIMRAAILFATAATAASCGGKEQQVPGTSTSSGGTSGTSGGTSGTSGGTSGTSGGTSGTSGGTSGTSGGTSGAVPPYGIPPIDGGEEEDADRDGGGAVPLYGPPPIDP